MPARETAFESNGRSRGSSSNSGSWECPRTSKALDDLHVQVQDLLGLHHMTLASISKIEKATENTYILVSNMQDSGVTGSTVFDRAWSPTSPRRRTAASKKITVRDSSLASPKADGRYLDLSFCSTGSETEEPPRAADKPKLLMRNSIEPLPRAFGQSYLERVDSGSPLRDLPSQWPACIDLRQGLLIEPMEQAKLTRHFSTLTDRRTLNTCDSGGLESDGSNCGKGFDPDARFVVTLDWLALLVLMYDVLVTPYALAWNVPVTPLYAGLAALSASFWTCRLVSAFWMGFYLKGELVLDRKEIAKRYIRGAFIFDVFIVVVDWFVLVLGSMPVLRFTSLLRLAKVFRLANAMTLLEKLLEAMFPRSALLMRITQVTCCMLCFTHLMCCFWYAVGRSEVVSDTDSSWLDRVEDTSTYPYLTSFHWTLAQVTLGATEINPVNSAERVFAIVLLVFGTLFSATIVAFISSETMEYVTTRRENLQMMSQLKTYLRQNHVVDQLKSRIHRQVVERLYRSDQPLSEDIVEAIKLLSTTLRADLKRETRVPHLITHALFSAWLRVDMVAMRRLCDEAVSFATFKAEDNIFLPGEEVDTCINLNSGKLDYEQDPETSFERKSLSRSVVAGHWICEAALWTHWITVGCLNAAVGCKVMLISADGVAKVLAKHPVIGFLTRHYAQAYHLRITAARPPYSKWPSDLHVPDTAPSDLMSNDIGLELLRQAEKKGSISKAAHDELVQELKDEKCSIQDGATGRLERIVPVVVVKIRRPSDGRILAEVGSWTRQKGLKVGCALPGKKRHRGELVQGTVERIMSTELHLFGRGIEVMGQDSNIEARESEQYGIYTKYLRTVQQMELREGFSEPSIPQARMAGRASTKASRSSLVMVPLAVLAQGRDPFVEDDVAENILVLESYDGARVGFYSWMKPATLDFMLSELGKGFVRNWVGRIDTACLPEESRQHGQHDSFASDELGAKSQELEPVQETLESAITLADAEPELGLLRGTLLRKGTSEKSTKDGSLALRRLVEEIESIPKGFVMDL